LMHKFQSEVISLGLSFPPELQTRFRMPSGQACWHSLSNLIATAASIVLQVDRSELQTGVRPLLRGTQLSGEAFIYDNVPGGAGYARATAANLPKILEEAAKIGHECSNPDCQGACYQCLLNYRNQSFHDLLDRHLGTAMLRYALNGEHPRVSLDDQERLMDNIESNLDHAWERLTGGNFGGTYYPAVLRPRHGQTNEPVALRVLHPMQSPPGASERGELLATHGLRLAAFDTFDLARRPYTVLTQLQDGQG
jgi:hypothetical protein